MELALLLFITEIMYNPDSNEGRAPDPPNRVEWVELYNAGDTAIDLGEFYLRDEDGWTSPIPQGTTIDPKQTLVLVPGEITADDFRAAWGDGIHVVPLTGWGDGMKGLANSPSEENEQLRLCNADNEVVDAVNYDDEGDWPRDSPDGPSIYLKPEAIGPDGSRLNDDGSNWARSEIDVAGGRANTKTEIFNGNDVGSPGAVPVE